MSSLMCWRWGTICQSTTQLYPPCCAAKPFPWSSPSIFVGFFSSFGDYPSKVGGFAMPLVFGGEDFTLKGGKISSQPPSKTSMEDSISSLNFMKAKPTKMFGLSEGVPAEEVDFPVI